MPRPDRAIGPLSRTVRTPLGSEIWTDTIPVLPNTLTTRSVTPIISRLRTKIIPSLTCSDQSGACFRVIPTPLIARETSESLRASLLNIGVRYCQLGRAASGRRGNDRLSTRYTTPAEKRTARLDRGRSPEHRVSGGSRCDSCFETTLYGRRIIALNCWNSWDILRPLTTREENIHVDT